MSPVRAPITAPPAAPPRVSLLTSARTVDDPDLRWTGGVELDPEAPAAAAADGCDPGTWTVPDPAGSVQADPMVVWAGERCSALSVGARDYQARARRALEACTPAQVASELWTGAQAQAAGWPNLWLAGGSAGFTNLSPTPADVSPGLYGLAALQEYLGDTVCGARGMIHATRNAVTLWQRYGLLRREGQLIVDLYDNIVVPGPGYDGSDPAGDVDPSGETAWAYATGLVEVRLGPPVVTPDLLADAVDRSVNTVEFRAWRLALATWDGQAHAGIRVGLCELACEPVGS